jgi:aspartate beta-hydroxylase
LSTEPLAAQIVPRLPDGEAPLGQLLRVLEPFEAREVERVRGMLEIAAGLRPVPPLADLQEMRLLFVPGLTDKPWYERSAVPVSSALERGYPDIRDELTALRSQDRMFINYRASYGKGGNAPRDNDPGWRQFAFYRSGRRIDSNCERAPRTAAILDSLQISHDAAFSLLDPGTTIEPHSDWLNFWVTCHLGLEIPPTAWIRVGTETRTWREGECLVLSTSFEHEASNPSDQRRIVLLVDTWHPDLSPVEIEAMKQLRPHIERFLGLTPG